MYLTFFFDSSSSSKPAIIQYNTIQIQFNFTPNLIQLYINTTHPSLPNYIKPSSFDLFSDPSFLLQDSIQSGLNNS
ncbi:hypothetical protein L1987_21200 [Smallanthus sonchifolius]|uniref:Uncharacterized protein n=1 Tax=Smallanthus sonchifolius TaxID=185202 RepID=A0ACB9IUG5_9ASTR|nr:hypothetical protein L1987_21200 [Smallanthus sonchifolius]